MVSKLNEILETIKKDEGTQFIDEKMELMLFVVNDDECMTMLRQHADYSDEKLKLNLLNIQYVLNVRCLVLAVDLLKITALN